MRIAKPIEQLGMKLGGQRMHFLYFAIRHTTRALIVTNIAFLAESINLSDQLAVAT